MERKIIDDFSSIQEDKYTLWNEISSDFPDILLKMDSERYIFKEMD